MAAGPTPTMDWTRVPLAAAWLAALALVTWLESLGHALGEKRWTTPIDRGPAEVDELGPVDPRACSGDRVSTGEPRLTPMTPKGRVPGGPSTPGSWSSGRWPGSP